MGTQRTAGQIYYALEGVDGLKVADGGSALEAVLKYTIAPLGLLLWATFEWQAVQRIPAGGNPWSSAADLMKDGKPTKEVAVKQIAENSMQQNLMTILCAISIVTTVENGKIGDFDAVRFAVAHVYMYIVGRIFFSIGYITSLDEAFPGIKRVPGLLIGGFWLNAAYFLFGVLMLFGMANTAAALYICVIFLGLVVPIIIFGTLPGTPAGATELQQDEEKPIAAQATA